MALYVRSAADIVGWGRKQADMKGSVPLTGGLNILDVDRAQLERYIEEHGSSVQWRRAVSCPCARSDTRQPRVGCPNCRGLLYLYPERSRRHLKILMTSRQPNGKPWPIGEIVTGTVALTFLDGDIPHTGDLVLPQTKDGKATERHEVKQLLVRGHNQVDVNSLSYQMSKVGAALPKQRPQPERLRYAQGAEIDWLGWEDDQQRTVEGVEGADFNLVGNEIRWSDGQGPRAGQTYSVRYSAPAAYMVAESVFRGVGDVTLPRRVMAMRLDQWDPDRDYR